MSTPIERAAGLTGDPLRALLPAIAAGLGAYPYDQYRHYPARTPRDGRAPWEAYLLARLERMAADPDWSFFTRSDGPTPLLLGARSAAWDRENVGVGAASLSALYCPDGPDLRRRTGSLLRECLAALAAAGVTFVSARVNGDQLDVIHALEDAGFRYFETAVWPVAPLTGTAPARDPRVRLLVDADIERAMQLAADHGYRGSHFLRDGGFSREQVRRLNGAWIRTAWQAGEPIAVIESESGTDIAGVLAFRLDPELSSHLGSTYGRMRFLAVDAEARRQGLGRALFTGAMSLLRDMGAEHADSGYTTKNHLSARLHSQAGFLTAYEEATLHLWLSPP
ncbi:MAG: GNAT family N-acetyltransferase [Solirubrobacteraceae bacterium]|nr:GNAT family N-acetyltransferase [Solirubrobacteraceae bacterium]